MREESSFIYLAGIFLIALEGTASEKKNILFITSNMYDMGDQDKHDARNNLWEYAPPYHVFVSHGYNVDFLSPEGGPVPFMMDPVGIISYTIKYEGFTEATTNTLSPKDVRANEYAAVFIGGGYGTLFDVSSNKEIQTIIANIYESGGVVAGCGHGPGAFANVKLSNGEYLVNNKRVAGFPNETERAKSWAKNGELLPFLVEDQLNKNGAIALNKKLLKDKTEVVIDKNIVSTMFLPSAAIVAKETIRLLESE